MAGSGVGLMPLRVCAGPRDRIESGDGLSGLDPRAGRGGWILVLGDAMRGSFRMLRWAQGLRRHWVHSCVRR